MGFSAATWEDPVVDDAASLLLNPRPHRQVFSSLTERWKAHERLLGKGECARAAGNLPEACEHFEEAYTLLYRLPTLLALIHIKLQLGEAQLAAACYTKVIGWDDGTMDILQLERVKSELSDARQLYVAAQAIVRMSPVAPFNSFDYRERLHHGLIARARVANEGGAPEEAEVLFLEAWPLLRRPTTLISAANMMARQGDLGKLRLAVGLYMSLLGHGSHWCLDLQVS